MVNKTSGEENEGQIAVVPESRETCVKEAARFEAASSVRSAQSLISKLLRLPQSKWRQRKSAIDDLGEAVATERDRRIAASVLCGVLENSPRESALTRFARGSAWA